MRTSALRVNEVTDLDNDLPQKRIEAVEGLGPRLRVDTVPSHT
jgi:hypothetical protein